MIYSALDEMGTGLPCHHEIYTIDGICPIRGNTKDDWMAVSLKIAAIQVLVMPTKEASVGS
jgi:hypothetical protein